MCLTTKGFNFSYVRTRDMLVLDRILCAAHFYANAIIQNEDIEIFKRYLIRNLIEFLHDSFLQYFTT